jgi:hypothetical protein
MAYLPGPNMVQFTVRHANGDAPQRFAIPMDKVAGLVLRVLAALLDPPPEALEPPPEQTPAEPAEEAPPVTLSITKKGRSSSLEEAFAGLDKKPDIPKDDPTVQ